MSSPLKAICATLFEPFVIELGENHTPMDLINRGAPRGMSALNGDETNYWQESIRSGWQGTGSSGCVSSAWFDDSSMHRCGCLTERSLGA